MKTLKYMIAHVQHMTSKVIGVRLPPKDYEAMEQYVKEGYAQDMSDLAKQAIREKIAKIKASA